MRPMFSSWLMVGGALVAPACTLDAPPQPLSAPLICYSTPDGWSVRSTFSIASETDGERLLGTTELGSGARLVERAELDVQGRLVRAEARLESGAHPPVQLSFDRGRGAVGMDAAGTHFEWRVPTDYPWAWAPLLEDSSTGKPITTPLLARVLLRAVANDSPLRLLDLRTRQSPALTADQVVVDDEGEALAIVLDDTVQFKAGVPEHVYSGALGTSLDRLGTSCR